MHSAGIVTTVHRAARRLQIRRQIADELSLRCSQLQRLHSTKAARSLNWTRKQLIDKRSQMDGELTVVQLPPLIKGISTQRLYILVRYNIHRLSVKAN